MADGGRQRCSVSRIIRSQIQTYVSTRASQGFNTLQIDCVTPNYGGLNPNGIATDEGYTPWGATPFTTYETVNYWPKIDWIVQLCASYNILAFLNPYLQGGNSDLGNAGVAAATAYGTFLGNRYKNSPNVMWYFGNDYVVGSTTDFNAETALLQAIRNAGDTHMRTMEVGLGTGNGDWSFEEVAGGYGSFAANLEINGVYSAAPLYAPYFTVTTRRRSVSPDRLAPTGRAARRRRSSCWSPATVRPHRRRWLRLRHAGQPAAGSLLAADLWRDRLHLRQRVHHPLRCRSELRRDRRQLRRLAEQHRHAGRGRPRHLGVVLPVHRLADLGA